MFGRDKTLTRSQQLLADAREAAELRAYRTHPDVAALAIERIRTAVGVLVWTGLVLGLLFTMSNVAAFAARGAVALSVPWLIAWLLDPMVSLCLVGVLIAESTLARYQIAAGRWVRGAKWGLLAATYLMNTWSAWRAGVPSLILLHSVPPAVVFVMAEAITDLRARLTDAVVAAHRYATAALAATTDPDRATDAAASRVLPDLAATPVTAVERTAPAAGADSPDRIEDRPATDPSEDQAVRTAVRNGDAAHRSGPGHTPGTGPRGDADRSGAGPDISDLFAAGMAVRDRLAAEGQKLSRRALIAGLRADGHAVSTDRAGALLKRLTADAAPAHTRETTDTRSGAQAASEAA